MILERARHLHQLEDLLTRYPVVAILGARQVGKTTLARQLVVQHLTLIDPDRVELHNMGEMLGVTDAAANLR